MEDLICKLIDCINTLDDLEMEISEYGINATELEKAREIV